MDSGAKKPSHPTIQPVGRSIVSEFSVQFTTSKLAEKMRPVFAGLGGVGADTQCFGGAAVGDGIVDEERFGGVDGGVLQDVFEDISVGLHHVELVREAYLVEEVAGLVPVVGEAVLFRPEPMDLVGVAEQHGVVFGT